MVTASNKSAEKFLTIAALAEIGEAADFCEPMVYGHYKVVREIGSGSFSTVYEARDMRTSKGVALKVFLPNVAGKNFVREVGVGMRVIHPNLISAFDLGYAADSKCFVAYELALGGSIRQRIEANQSDRSFIRHAVVEGARGLTALHEKALVHRDVKPENILLHDNSKFSRLRLTDWGTAESVRHALAHGESGSPAYMSPEQIRGSCDTRADVYSLGVIMYELIGGKRPFVGAPVDVLRGHLEREPDWSGFEPKIIEVIGHALQKDPAERYQTAYHFARDLELALAADDESWEQSFGLQLEFNDSIIARDSVSDWRIIRKQAVIEIAGENAPSFSCAANGAVMAQICVSSLTQFAIRDDQHLHFGDSNSFQTIEMSSNAISPVVAIRRFSGDIITTEGTTAPQLIIRDWKGRVLNKLTLPNALSALAVLPGTTGENLIGIDDSYCKLFFWFANKINEPPQTICFQEPVETIFVRKGNAWIATTDGELHVVKSDGDDLQITENRL